MDKSLLKDHMLTNKKSQINVNHLPSEAGNLNDEKLWSSLIEGSEVAFDQLYTKYFNKLFVYSAHICADQELVKDCIQELFVELWRKRNTLSKVKFVRSYLYKSLRRKVVKNTKNKSKFYSSQHINDNLHIVYSRERELIENQTLVQNKKLLNKAFNTLTDRQKEIVLLKYYHGLSYDEISSIMSMQQVKSARTLLYRALDVLRASMAFTTIAQS